jgi:acetate---CoA ligase (ADP-forming)
MTPAFADISRLVNPRRVAVVGASGRPGSLGYSTYNNVRNHSRIAGGVFAVNPQQETVLGDDAYDRVSDIPGEPMDVVIVLVAAGRVPDVVADCARAGAAHVMVLSSGFSETGASGVRLQAQITAIARETGMRLYGPNSPGLANIADQILLSMSPVAADDVHSGPVGLVTQGGGLGRCILQWMDRGLGVGLWASPGNEADVDVSDFINFMIDDERIAVIGAVVEGFSSGAKFVDVARRALRAGKPLVVLKIGRSRYGVETAASHTASIAGNDQVTDAVFAQYGVVRVEDVDELAETLIMFEKALGSGIAAVGDVCVYSFSGGTAALGADMTGAAGLRLATFAPATLSALTQRAPSFGFVGNPVDLTTRVFTDSELNQAVFEIICSDPGVGSVLLAMPADYGDSTSSVATDVLEIARRHGKLLIPVWMSPRRGGGYAVLSDAGFAPFDGLRRAVTALRRVCDWAGLAVAGTEPGSGPSGPADAGAGEQTADGPGPGPSDRALPYEEARAFVERTGARFPREVLASSPEQAAQAVRDLGGTTVIKLAAPGLIHKTEVGGVRLGVTDPAVAAAVYEEMTSASRLAPFGVAACGVYVQEMLGEGIDILLGVHDDEVFGPVLTFGTGGTGTELERDVLHLAIPFDEAQFGRALRTLRLWPRLRGARGAPPADTARLFRVARTFAELFVAGSGRIAEAEINPLRVLVTADRTDCVALDAVLLGR